MKFIDSIDPFVMQLIIVPLLVIGLGILVVIISKRLILAPIVTLLLNVLYELWYMQHYYPSSEMGLTSWNVIFPLISLFISWLILAIRKEENKEVEIN